MEDEAKQKNWQYLIEARIRNLEHEQRSYVEDLQAQAAKLRKKAESLQEQVILLQQKETRLEVDQQGDKKDMRVQANVNARLSNAMQTLAEQVQKLAKKIQKMEDQQALAPAAPARRGPKKRDLLSGLTL